MDPLLGKELGIELGFKLGTTLGNVLGLELGSLLGKALGSLVGVTMDLALKVLLPIVIFCSPVLAIVSENFSAVAVIAALVRLCMPISDSISTARPILLSTLLPFPRLLIFEAQALLGI